MLKPERKKKQRGEHLRIIAGIDPGTTAGIVALDLKGNFVSSASLRDAGMEDVVERVRTFGKPSIIACDVRPVPDFVLRLAASFNARIFSPEKGEMREEEKKALVLASAHKFASTHERDAYSAAIKAYRAFANRLRQIDLLSDFDERDREELKHLVLNGYSLKNALFTISKPKEAAQAPSLKPITKREEEQKRRDMSQEFSSLASESAHLRKALERLEGERELLLHRIRLFENGVNTELSRDHALKQRDGEIVRLRNYIVFLKSDFARRIKATQKDAKSEQKRREELEFDRESAGLKKLGSDNLDALEQMISEYRRKRK